MPFGHLFVFFEEMSILICPLFWLGCIFLMMLSLMSCLQVLDTTYSLVTSFANIFSYPVGCLFILFMVSFAVQKLYSLISFYFLIIFITLGDRFKKDIAMIYVKKCYMFSSRSLIVSSLTFRSLIHLELIFVYSVKECCSFIF